MRWILLWLSLVPSVVWPIAVTDRSFIKSSCGVPLALSVLPLRQLDLSPFTLTFLHSAGYYYAADLLNVHPSMLLNEGLPVQQLATLNHELKKHEMLLPQPNKPYTYQQSDFTRLRQMAQKNIYKLNIVELILSVRTEKRLIRHGYSTVGELLICPAEQLELRVGPLAYQEILMRLRDVHLRPGMWLERSAPPR